ncbi:MAG: acyl carrier protein [Pseudohongiellaceae bacterium]|jgi:acyl carrier protein
MSNTEKLASIFTNCLCLAPEDFDEGLSYNTIPEWDSTGHMALVVGIEKGFDVMLDMDDIIDMSSFAASKAILKKYDIEFND